MAMRVAIMGAGAGGSAAAVELSLAGHSVALWSRSPQTLLPLERAGGLGYQGVLGEGRIVPDLLTCDASAAASGADAVLVCLPTTSHREIAQTLAHANLARRMPVVLNPGHTGGALEFAQAYREAGAQVPPVAELSTLTYVARKYAPETVTITSCARTVRAAALAGGETALAAACTLFRSVKCVADVLASDLSNVNMVLHPPGAVLGAAWVEARRGDFTFYVEGMTKGVGRVLRALDEERRAVARAFGHDLPALIEEMKAIGTVEAACPDNSEPACAISGGEANRHIKAPDSLAHRYYQEDFGHGLLPFCELAAIARVPVPIALALLRLGSCLTGVDFTTRGRTAARMGIAGFTTAQLIAYVRG